MVRYSTLILIGIVFAKSSLGQSAIGEYETFIFLAAAISFFWLNGLLKALLPLSSGFTKAKTNIFSAFVLIQLFSLLATAVLYLAQPFFSNFLLNGNEIPEINLLLVFVILGTPANLVEYFYLIKKRNRAIIIYALFAFSIQFILVVLPVLFNLGIQMALKGLLLSVAIRYVWLWVIFISEGELSFSLSFVREHLKLGLPLVVATFFSGSAQFIDGFIVTSKFDAETFAVFRYGARELPLAMLLANALSNAMLPDFANTNNLFANLKKLKSSVNRLMHILFPLTALLLLISKPVFPILFNPDFAKSATIFNIYLLLVISRMLMPQTILNGLKISKPIVTASFLELVLNVGLSLILVQFLGITGIALATIVAYLFEKVYLSIRVHKNLNIKLSQYLSVRNYLAYSVGILVIFIFAELIF